MSNSYANPTVPKRDEIDLLRLRRAWELCASPKCLVAEMHGERVVTSQTIDAPTPYSAAAKSTDRKITLRASSKEWIRATDEPRENVFAFRDADYRSPTTNNRHTPRRPEPAGQAVATGRQAGTPVVPLTIPIGCVTIRMGLLSILVEPNLGGAIKCTKSECAMSERQPQTVPERIALNQLADDPMIAMDITNRILRGSVNDNLNFVRGAELEAELLDMGKPQKDVKAAIFFGDADFLLLGLYGAYFFIVTGATVFVLLHWGHVP